MKIVKTIATIGIAVTAIKVTIDIIKIINVTKEILEEENKWKEEYIKESNERVEAYAEKAKRELEKIDEEFMKKYMDEELMKQYKINERRVI